MQVQVLPGPVEVNMTRDQVIAMLPPDHPTRLKLEAEGKARGPSHKAGVMNKTEARYRDYLPRFRTLADHIRFEAITLTLSRDGRGCRYTPDFSMINGGRMEFHEVKAEGNIRDDAMVKLKWAAREFPEFRFVLAVWSRREQRWDVREVRP